ncbi:MAG TPA: hypothetical protein VMS12_04605 [Thermoanaerobaculia bacterium]|nr:hypothetical protein [Thermoanaerobaculia bacterium]
MKKLALVLFLSLIYPSPAESAIVDRIAATIDREVITLSQIDQIVIVRLIAQRPDESEDDYRRRVLNALIAQTLRYRDVQRFGVEDVSPDAIESRLRVVISRFSSEDEFVAALRRAEQTLEDVRASIRRQLQVENYIDERFSPTIFVSLEEIETYYRDVWLAQRADRGLPPVPLAQVREEIRTLLRADRLRDQVEVWTSQLRASANVDIFAYR